VFLLGTWKYVSVKVVQSYSVFHALSNGAGFAVSARSQKFDPVDMTIAEEEDWMCSLLSIECNDKRWIRTKKFEMLFLKEIEIDTLEQRN
jgi:hypothetical protein